MATSTLMTDKEEELERVLCIWYLVTFKNPIEPYWTPKANDFQARDLQWRSYTIKDVLLTTRQVKLIGKKKFAAAVLDSKHKTFLLYVVAFNIDSGDEVHSSRKAQIAYLKANKVPSKYTDFVDVFLSKLATELPEYNINDHVIEFVDDWQPLYDTIYSLKPVELEILKSYLKNNLANGLSPLLVHLFLLDKKLDGSLRLCIDYRALNNLTIKN